MMYFCACSCGPQWRSSGNSESSEPLRKEQVLFSNLYSLFILRTVFVFQTVRKKARKPLELFRCLGTRVLKGVQVFHGDLNISEEQLDKKV